MGITPLLAACQEVSSISRKAQQHIYMRRLLTRSMLTILQLLRHLSWVLQGAALPPVLRHERVSFSEYLSPSKIPFRFFFHGEDFPTEVGVKPLAPVSYHLSHD